MGRLVDEHPELVAQWDYDKNQGISPDEFTSGSGKKVWWRCDKGHEWQTAIYNRSKGSSCPYCSGNQLLIGYNDLATVNPEVAAQWHPIKNGDLTPKMITARNSKKVWWICDKGHEWQATPSNRSKGSGCPYCAGQRALSGINDLGTLRPDIAAQWHPTKNGDLLPKDVMPGTNKKVWWQCEKGHEWQASVNNRSRGTGCPYCSGRIAISGENDLATIYPKLAMQWHPTKNGNLKPSEVTIKSNKKVWWICDKGHEWQAVISSRSAGQGCPQCYSERQTSFPEQAILYYLINITPAEGRVKFNNKYEVDIYLPEMKTAIEYDGLYWHSNKESLIREKQKDKYLVEAGIRLIRIKEIDAHQSLPIDEPDTIYCYYSQNNKYLNNVIERLLHHIGIFNGIDIDIDRDKTIIWNRYIVSEKKTSLAYVLPEIAAEWHPTKNGTLMPTQITPGSNKKVWWMCSKGHEWVDTPNNRSNGCGCPYCSGHQIQAGYNDLATIRPDLATQWHPTKNGDLMPTQIAVHSNKKVWWRCDKGHEWVDTPNDRNDGCGCPYCSGHQIQAGYNDLATIRPDLAAQWHPTKNGDLMPTQIAVHSNKKVWWQCEKGHEWQTTVDKRSNGNNCPICSGKQVLAGYNDLITVNPELAAQWHPVKNGKLRPSDVTVNSNKKVWWQCKLGHEWQATIADRNSGRNCPFCSGHRVKVGFNDLATKRPDLAAQWHPSKNGDLTPDQVTVSSGKKVWWQCENGHEWQAAIYSRNAGNSCPQCRRMNKEL